MKHAEGDFQHIKKVRTEYLPSFYLLRLEIGIQSPWRLKNVYLLHHVEVNNVKISASYPVNSEVRFV